MAKRKPPTRAVRAPEDGDADLPSFGRPPQGAVTGGLTDLGCPDCRGVLAVTPIKGDYLSFTCRIGHAFSTDSLLSAKEEQLETALWTVVQIYSEVSSLYSDLAKRPPRPGDAASYLQRASRAEKNVEAVRSMIDDDGPPTASKRVGQGA